MTQQAVLRRDDISEFITNLYDSDLHAKRVLSLANATLGVLTSPSLAIHAVGQGLAQAMGRLSKHGVKQVDRLLSNDGIDVGTFFGHWVPYMVGARTEIVVALDWTSFRDIKDMRFGMGMSAMRIRHTVRRDRLLLLSALSIALLTMLGAAGESLGYDRWLKANTVKTHTHSLFRQGLMHYYHIPNWPEHRLRPLVEKYAALTVTARCAWRTGQKFGNKCPPPTKRGGVKRQPVGMLLSTQRSWCPATPTLPSASYRGRACGLFRLS